MKPITCFQVSHSRVFKGVSRFITSAATIALIGLASGSAFAADPFRSEDPHNIGDQTEAAFYAFFRDGDYVEARQYLMAAEETEAAEPMVQAMLASLAYLDGDLDELAARAEQTQTAANALIAVDPLRGHLYAAVGTFLEGAHLLKTEGTVRSMPTVLSMLQQVFNHLDQAERISRTDPELNLVKGYMDLLLAVNLPFANPQQAIERLESYGYPPYLTQRGLAIAYRDLKQYDEALTAINKALEVAANNPELLGLQGQIYARLGQREESLASYEKALTYRQQLPEQIALQLQYEHCKVADVIPNSECSTQFAAGSFE
ncbi:Sll0314/Alr1548 family TPR repeat-containing protein [Almyronema epifaneia]|uniref:Sll0314/Alr1548 family TPR repeat-containing protein n=1 Tax=Almyronema epifaneia S1 TaxID=2991925 RepID=A0ABW6IEU4_9CYAN